MRGERKKARSIKRREFLQLSGAGAVATRATLEPAPEKKPPTAKARSEAAGPRLQRRLHRRAPEPRGLPAGRHRRGHDLPGRHGRALARLAAQPARGFQRAAACSRRSASRASADVGPRARRAGAGLEALRRARAPATAPAARRYGLPRFRERHVPRALPVRDGRRWPIRRRAARGRDHRLEPVRAGRRRQCQPAGGGAGIPVHQPQQARRSRRCFPSTPRTSWPSGDNPQAVQAAPGGFMLWGGAGKDKPLGGRRVLGDGQRPGGRR